jgi:hypothetical protein
MKRHWSTRLLGAALALWFGLSMVGPEVHQCPLHDLAPATAAAAHASGHASHDTPKGHEHCSCPQACCPAGVALAAAAVADRSSAAPTPVVLAELALPRVVLPRAPRHLLPFALAPPHTLA